MRIFLPNRTGNHAHGEAQLVPLAADSKPQLFTSASDKAPKILKLHSQAITQNLGMSFAGIGPVSETMVIDNHFK